MKRRVIDTKNKMFFLFLTVRNYALITPCLICFFEEKDGIGAQSSICVYDIKAFLPAHKTIQSPNNMQLIRRESGASINHKHSVMGNLQSYNRDTLTQHVGTVHQ